MRILALGCSPLWSEIQMGFDFLIDFSFSNAYSIFLIHLQRADSSGTRAGNNTKKDIDETRLLWTLLLTRIFMGMKLSEHQQKPKMMPKIVGGNMNEEYSNWLAWGLRWWKFTSGHHRIVLTHWLEHLNFHFFEFRRWMNLRLYRPLLLRPLKLEQNGQNIKIWTHYLVNKSENVIDILDACVPGVERRWFVSHGKRCSRPPERR